MIWQFNYIDVYSSHSLYKVNNFRGVSPMYMPAIWKLFIPPRVQFFLWLVSKNKVLTRDNLRKEGQCRILPVYSVGRLSQLVICCFSVWLPGEPGP
jgi:hypothetical protein